MLLLALDVTNVAQIGGAAAQARFGRLDVVVNTAGSALLGAIEETSEADVRAESLDESLAHEVEGFGIKVTLIEPGACATDFSSALPLKLAAGIDAYAPLRAQLLAGAAATL